MFDKHLHRVVVLPALAVALSLGGCGSDSDMLEEPVFPDVSSPRKAVTALEDAYGKRLLDDALYLHEDDFQFFPDSAASVSFLAPGETSWDWDREVAILERLLVPERISWLDQVLLEIDISEIDESGRSAGTVTVRGNADLLLLKGTTELLQSSADLELLYNVDGEGNHFLAEIRETAVQFSDYTVGELKSLVEDPPTVVTKAAEDVSTTTATLHGEVNANELPTMYWFEWGTDTAYDQATAKADGGENFVAVERVAALTGLEAGTEYHYRVVAESDWGISRGEDVTFTTLPPLGP